MCKNITPNIQKGFDKLMAEVGEWGLQAGFAHYRTQWAVIWVGGRPPKVQPRFKRYYRSQPTFSPWAKGGATRCRLFNDKAEVVAEYTEQCSMDDGFRYDKGRLQALSGALRQYKGSRIWIGWRVNGEILEHGKLLPRFPEDYSAEKPK